MRQINHLTRHAGITGPVLVVHVLGVDVQRIRIERQGVEGGLHVTVHVHLLGIDRGRIQERRIAHAVIAGKFDHIGIHRVAEQHQGLRHIILTDGDVREAVPEA